MACICCQGSGSPHDCMGRDCIPTIAHTQATLSLSRRPTPPSTSNMTREDYMHAVDQVKEHIQAGDIFQLVLSHRFKRRTFADPFEIYRHAPPSEHPSGNALQMPSGLLTQNAPTGAAPVLHGLPEGQCAQGTFSM